MKMIFVFIVLLFTSTAKAGICDTLGFKVNVPKISKADDRVVGIKITFDTLKNKSDLLIIIDGVPASEIEFSAMNSNQIKNITLLQEAPGQIIFCRPFPPVLIVTTIKDRPQKIIIKNEDGEEVSGASLSVVLDDKKANALNLFADADGEIVTDKLLRNKTYTVSVSSIGYETKITKLNFANSDKKVVVLKKQFKNCDEVILKSSTYRKKSHVVCDGVRLISGEVKLVREKICEEHSKVLSELSFKIYPNPVLQGSQITIELPKQIPSKTQLQLYNPSGQLILQQQINTESNIEKIMLPNMASGIYQVLVLNGAQKLLSGRLLVL